jgi:hypothetical protein
MREAGALLSGLCERVSGPPYAIGPLGGARS